MNDIHQLAQRFLDGLTTTEEERRLHELLRQDDAPDELRALLPMLEKPNLGHYADLWLTEDETETYRDIVRQRKLRKALRWATAAAAMAVVAIMLTGKPGNGHEKVFTHTDTVGMQLMKPTHAMALTKPDGTSADTAIHHADPRGTGPKSARQYARKPSTTVDSTPKGTQNADSLDYYLARLEKELDRVGDSVYTAQVEKMIRTDARLQEIINRKLLDYLLAPDNDNAKNNMTTTRNDTEQ